MCFIIIIRVQYNNGWVVAFEWKVLRLFVTLKSAFTAQKSLHIEPCAVSHCAVQTAQCLAV